MDLFTLLGIAMALAMDAFAVALGAGLILPRLTGRHLFRFGFHFGLFQALMPLLGWAAGRGLRSTIEAYDHWIAFALLAVIGVRMCQGALRQDAKNAAPKDPTRGWSLIMLSIATSIDALAVGLTLAMLGSPIFIPALIIGLVCAVLTLLGMFLGRKIGRNWGPRVEFAGGLLLFGIGLKILLEHTLLNG
ncbi:manganese efflux pump MntP family protein [Geopsychrobacter electrodiphilus]|uniref:manganese efflux pump MntP n=1 Tax=Geopsychrobacter electrodiphilus TaxID=225196 RepID=UPI00037CEA94|nr:manganese efflux pump MntP family protein [Geopsychrobacter electrodiphilus]